MKTKLLTCMLCLAMCIKAGDTVRPGLEPLESEWQIENTAEAKLVQAIKTPFIEGMDVQKPLQKWFDGRLLSVKGKKEEATQAWEEGLKLCKDFTPLPQPVWKDIPDATFKPIAHMRLRSPNVRVDVVEWTVDNLKQYGVLVLPPDVRKGDQYPVILYCHGAAFGVPESFLPWLGTIAAKGYVIVCPAMRGEQLFQRDIEINGKVLRCEGEIENLDGEVNDCLSMLKATWKLSFVKKNEFAMIGHSFGSGVGLLCCARANKEAKAIVSYDAWLVSPQRYYWDRMARGANNWLSWADFCNQPVEGQLAGLMKRSIVHNADKLKCKMLFFIGGAYEGSVFHQSHDDLCKKLDSCGTPYSYNVMPGGGHNFVLYTESEPAQKALAIQNKFLAEAYPPYVSPNSKTANPPPMPKPPLNAPPAPGEEAADK